MRADDLRRGLEGLARDERVPVHSSADVIRRGRRRVALRRGGAAAVVVALVGAAVGFAVAGRHHNRSDVIVSPTPTTTKAGPVPSVGADAQVLFTSPNEGWICGNRILHTADAGAHWQIGSYRSASGGTRLCAAVPTDAWTLHQSAERHTELVLVQGGIDTSGSIDLTDLLGGARVVDLTFADVHNGWILAVPPNGTALHGLLYRSTLGGVRPTLVSRAAPIGGVRFTSATEGWGIDGGTLLHTTDAGATWTPSILPTPTPVPELGIFLVGLQARGSTIVVQGSRPSGNLASIFFVVSDDGGRTWTLRDGPRATFGSTEAVQLAVADTAHWRIAVEDRLWLTDEGGVTWQSRALPATAASVAFPAADQGWMTGAGGILYRTTDAGRSWSKVDTAPEPPWSDGLAIVPTQCPSRPVAAVAAGVDPRKMAIVTAKDFALRTLGWTGEQITAYPVLEGGGQFGEVFSYNVPKFCDADVGRLSWGVELYNPSITQDTSREHALVVAPFADGWKVWGFYR